MTQTKEKFRTTNVKFLEEWNANHFDIMKQAIKRHFGNKMIDTYHGKTRFPSVYNAIDQVLGLAYTSSSKCAMLSICNTEAWLDQDRIYSYQYFAIGEGNIPYAICQDKNENELCIRL
jgi:hypothetical protein